MSVYAGAVLAFFLGAAFVKAFPWRRGTARLNARPYAAPGRLPVRGLEGATVFLSVAVLVSKILLIPLGVYSVYVFDADVNVGGVWSASMALSEVLVMMIVAVLVSRRSVLAPTFLFGFACLSTNLLHGTRIFDVVAMLSVAVYYVLTVGLTRRVLLWSALGTGLSFAVLYLAFVGRATYAYSDDATSLTVVLSPIVYEAVFSQMSLLGFLQMDVLTPLGHPFSFLMDAVSFVIPRFLNPDKDSGSLLAQYADLSPVGAFSGHAAGLIYFGYSLYFVHFLLGAFGSWLQRRAKESPVALVIYIYFTGDILFRLMRDGVVYPIKYFTDSVSFLCLSLIVLGYFRFRPADRPLRGAHAG